MMNVLYSLLVFTGLLAYGSAVCEHRRADDILEFICNGGDQSDLDRLPMDTGKLRIFNMPLRRITKDTFARFGSELWVLTCSDCDIVDIEPGAFRRLDNLQQLNLNNNHLATVRADWFEGLNYLTFLDLSYNNIRIVDDGVFENLPSLVDLRLSGNQLECLNLADLSNLKDLQRMFLSENPEFKCPNAVEQFLEERGVEFDKDSEWRRITHDLVSPMLPWIGYDRLSTTKMPSFREKLHSTSMTTTDVSRTTAYLPVEEVVNFPTPRWRPIEGADPGRPESWTTTESYYEHTRRPTVSSEPATLNSYSEYYSTEPSISESNIVAGYDSVSVTTQRPMYQLCSSSTCTTASVHQQHENEDETFEQPVYSAEAIRPPSSAPSQVESHPTSDFLEPNMGQSFVPDRPDQIPGEGDGSLYEPSLSAPRPAEADNMHGSAGLNVEHTILPNRANIQNATLGHVDGSVHGAPVVKPNQVEGQQNIDQKDDAFWPPAPGQVGSHQPPDFSEVNMEDPAQPGQPYEIPEVYDGSMYRVPAPSQIEYQNSFPNHVQAGKTYSTSEEDPEFFAKTSSANEEELSKPVTNRSHMIRPAPYVPPGVFQPSLPNDLFETPYYEPTVTIRPPPAIYQRTEENSSASGLPIETSTTDKPLPDCPNRNSGSNLHTMIFTWIPVFLVTMKNLFPQRF